MTETHLSEPSTETHAHLSPDSELEFENAAHLSDEPLSAFENAAHLLGSRPSVSSARMAYQHARLNCFVPHAQRHQLDALTNEWDCTLTEAVRRVLEMGFYEIMHSDQVLSE